MLAVLVGALVSFGSLSVGLETVNAATESHDVAMLGCLSQRLVRPSSYTLGCGSGTYVLTNVHWADWGGSKARGTGNYVLNTCSPTCAADNSVSHHATFVLDHVRKTSRGRVYGALTINYLHHGRHSTVTWDLPPFPA